MDPQRSYPDPDSTGSHWYPGERGYVDPEWGRHSGAPEPRGYDYDNTSRYADLTVGPRSGEPLPPGTAAATAGPPGPAPMPPPFPPPGAPQPPGPVPAAPAGPAGDPTGQLPPVRPPGVYRSRHPALIAALAVMAVLVEVSGLRLFIAAFAHASVSGTVASSLLVMGVPMFALGMYALLTGAAAAPGQPAVRPWLRSPLAYLPVGLILLIAAAVAAA